MKRLILVMIFRITYKEGVVEMTKTQEPCLAKIGKYWERADFLGVFQHSGTNLIFGHQFAGPVAVVRFRGRLVKVEIENIDFCEVENEQVAT